MHPGVPGSPAEAGLDPSYLYKRKSHGVHRILVSGFPGGSCNGYRPDSYREQTATLLWSGNDNELCPIASTHLFGYASLFICSGRR
jgi:hypothetical protein